MAPSPGSAGCSGDVVVDLISPKEPAQGIARAGQAGDVGGEQQGLRAPGKQATLAESGRPGEEREPRESEFVSVGGGDAPGGAGAGSVLSSSTSTLPPLDQELAELLER